MIALTALIIYLAAVAVAIATAKAGRYTVPGWWLPGALCVHRHESVNWHIHNEPYANGFQFMLGTWIRAGGSASTWVSASPAEQIYRAFVIWRQDGGSWREWPNTSRMCGLR